MAKLTKKVVETAETRANDYFIWCSELPGFGVRIFPSGKRSYLVQYRKGGRSRRAKIGPHGRLTTEEARKEARALLGQVAKGGNPAEDRATQRNSMTVQELCERYLNATERGLVLGKGRRAKKESTLYTDRSRIKRHIIPLLGRRLVKDLTQSDVHRFIRDVASGKTAIVEKTSKLRGKAVVEGGIGAAARTAGLLGGILSFAVAEGVIETNPARGVARPADNRRELRLRPEDYRKLGKALAEAAEGYESDQAVSGAWLLMLSGCRRGEIEGLRWLEVDEPGHCFRLENTKEGRSVRPMGQPVFDVLSQVRRRPDCPYVLAGARRTGYFGGLPGSWERIAKQAGLPKVTPHTLRHSFASVAGDLGFSEPTIAAMLGHASGSVTSRYVHHLDLVLIAAADRVAQTIWRYATGEAGEVVDLASCRLAPNTVA
jgi:integrase